MNINILGTKPQLLSNLEEGKRQLALAQAKVDGIKQFIKATELELDMQKALETLTLEEQGVKTAQHFYDIASTKEEKAEAYEKFCKAIVRRASASRLVQSIEAEIITS